MESVNSTSGPANRPAVTRFYGSGPMLFCDDPWLSAKLQIDILFICFVSSLFRHGHLKAFLGRDQVVVIVRGDAGVELHPSNLS
jgi:hypothetical protein